MQFKSVGKPVHPTQKPVELYEYLIRTYSNPGDVIVDPFMGSGTTGVACMNVGARTFYGFERDPEYFAMAHGRICEAVSREMLAA